MSIVHLRCPSSVVSQQFALTTSPKPLGGLSANFTGMILRWSPFKVVQRTPFQVELLLPWQPKGKTWKNILVKNYRSDFIIIWYRWSLCDPLLFWLVEKTWPPGAVASFSYVNIICVVRKTPVLQLWLSFLISYGFLPWSYHPAG